MRNFLDICLLSRFFTWIPLDLFHVSCFITVLSFIIFDTSECQHSHYLVIGKITSSFWKILFAKSLIFSFWIYIETFMYDIKNTEQLKQSLNTDWNVLTSSLGKISKLYWHWLAENVQRIAKFLPKVCWVQILLLKNCKILLEMIKLWKIHFPKKSLIYFPIQKVLINFSQRFIRCTNFKKKA